MSDDHPDLSELAHATASPGAKRKRSISDHDSPDRAKKNAPAAIMSAADVENNAFIESAVEAVVAAGGVNVADLNALQQATAAEHSEASDPANASSTAAAALGSMYPSIHVPPTTEEQFAAQAANETNHGQDNSFHPNVTQPDALMDAAALSGMPGPGTPNGMSPPQPVHQPLPAQHRYSTGSVNQPSKKPDVGSEEWHKMRKDNHKEVERRRRETINEGINELAKIVPNCEKNKGSILQRAVTFINQLKENETQNIEKWTLEKLLTEQAIAELSTSNDKLKQECERLYKELETWKRVAQSHGLSLPQQNKEDTTTSTYIAYPLAARSTDPGPTKDVDNPVLEAVIRREKASLAYCNFVRDIRMIRDMLKPFMEHFVVTEDPPYIVKLLQTSASAEHEPITMEERQLIGIWTLTQPMETIDRLVAAPSFQAFIRLIHMP